ncbi:MAG TPA: OstA-like protein [Chitinophagaceae bacterium]|nr:OstA-like protein [Chitinophagaceae bacterium]
MNPISLVRGLLLAGLLAASPSLWAQVAPPPAGTGVSPGRDTLRTVEILPGAHKLEIRKPDDSTQLQILVGNVRLRQGHTLFYCDSCVINNRVNLFEAFGHVHINDSDTTDIYSDYLKYLTDKKIAYLSGNVKLTDGKGILTTPELEYDVNTRIGIYTQGGKVVNRKSVLTSQEGYYYADLKDVYFKKNVRLKDPAYQLTADSLLYNTATQISRFIADTYIEDSSHRTIRTRDGFYDMKRGKAEFGQNPVIQDGKTRITGNRIAIDDSTGISQAEGNAVVIDTSQGTTIIAGQIFRNGKTDAVLALKKPLMIVRQDKDSIYISADTLFSARLTDLPSWADSLRADSAAGRSRGTLDPGDSSNRYFEAYRHVRIFSDSLQSTSDSLFYSFRDSTFRLFQRPVVWARGSQITGDTMYLYTRNRKPDRLRVYENSFLVNQLAPEVFNQIKSTRMDGYFVDGDIDSVRARGFAECIYYIQNEDSAYTGVNKSQSDIMDIYFRQQELFRVVLRSSVKGQVIPIRQVNPRDMRLKNFQWLEDRRPKTKFELYE